MGVFANLPQSGAYFFCGPSYLGELFILHSLPSSFSAFLLLCFFVFFGFSAFGWFVSVLDAGLLQRRRFNADSIFTRRMLYQLSKGGVCIVAGMFSKHVLYQLS